MKKKKLARKSFFFQNCFSDRFDLSAKTPKTTKFRPFGTKLQNALYTYKAEPECQVCMCNVKRKRVVNFTCHENHWVCIDCFESLCHKLWRHGRRPFCCFCNKSVKVRNSPNPTIQRRICIAVRYNQATQLYEFLTCLKGGCVS